MNWRDYLELDLIYWSWAGTSLLALNFSLIGTSLVEKRMTLIGDTLSHAILPGVVLCHFLMGTSTGSLLLGGWVSGFLLLLLTFFISKRRSVYQESSFAFLALFFVAVGMILSFKTKTSPEILHLLFGQVLAFDSDSVVILSFLTAATLLIFWFTRRLWSLWIVDPQIFQSQKLSPFLEKTLILVSLSLLMTHLTLGLQALGAFMTVGLVVIPALISQQLDHRLYRRLFYSACISIFASFAGVFVSIVLDWPLGPSVVVILSVLYMTLLILKTPRMVKSV